jgi:predicted nucleic-acid-binding Zn-ribbon protein
VRTSLQCPKCSGRKIWRIERFETQSDSAESGWLLRVVIGRGLQGKKTTTGIFDAYICKGCGHTELYARNLAELQHDPQSGVHLLDGDAGQAPYR